MKCPKCGYVSFDYNLTCPKCNKDITAEQQKLNLLALRPDPPSLLGALLGQANESNVSLQMGGSAEIPVMHGEPDLGLEDSSVLDSGEIRLDDSQEVDLGLDFEPGGAEEGGEQEIGLEESMADFELEGGPADEAVGEAIELSVGKPEGTIEVEAKGEEAGEISLDLGDFSETPEQEEKTLLESIQKEEENLSIDLDDLSLEEPAAAGMMDSGPGADVGEEIGIDLDSLAVQSEDTATAGEKGEIALTLEDLKINETGELEIGRAGASLKSSEKPLDVEDLSLDLEGEPSAGAKTENEEDFTLLLDDDDLTEPAPSGDREAAIDLENLDLELDLEKTDNK